MAADDDQPTDELDPDATGPTRVADPPLIAPGRMLGGRYRLERRLGHGGMAVVWLATDERLDRSVAIKVISDTIAHDRDYLVRFRREAHTAAGLQHPHLVGVYDFDAGARPYLVMEYVSGGDLHERLAAARGPEPERLARELLSALRHIHAAGVLHRDIKPQNVLIDELGNARLTDFGIAQPADATALTRTGHVIGTESYIAPEVKGGAPASERSDLYALGVVLADVAGDECDPRLGELIDGLRDEDPERRPQSASAALAQLEGGGRVPAGEATAPYAIEAAGDAEQAAAARPPFEPTVAGRRGRGRAIGALLATVLAIAAITGVVMALSGGEESGGGGGGGNAEKPAKDEGEAGAGDSAPAPAPAAEEPPPASDESEPVADSEDGFALEAAGYQAFLDGDYEGAIEASSQAVELLRGSGEPQYYYALFNLGTSLRHAGRPEEALPYLQERLEFDDNLEAVQAEIDLVEAEIAGEKPGNGPKQGKTPPPFEEDDD